MPSSSIVQRKLMGAALAFKRGELKNPPARIKKIAESMNIEQLEDFAKKVEDVPYRKAKPDKSRKFKVLHR